MRTAPIIVFVALLAALSPVAAFADGILNIPSRNGVGRLMPLVCVDVEIEIHDQVAITTVRNSFEVEGDSTLSLIYNYRLPTTASVIGFGVFRGDTLQPFNLRPGEGGGHDTSGFGEQNADLRNSLGSNPFVIPLHRIEPGLLMVQLRFVQLLTYDFGVVSYEYPLKTEEYLRGPIDTVSINGVYNSQREVLEIGGNFEGQLQFEAEDEYHGTFSLDLANANPEHDVQVHLNYDQEDIGAWILTHRSNSERDGYFILIIDPGIVDSIEVVTKYFTFVIDRSGSMQGAKIAQAKNAILRCLDNLFPRDYLNIIDFAHDVRRYSNEMLPANAENVSQARNYVNRIAAEGWTNSYGALMTAVGQEMAEGTANQIIFATDGIPTAGEYQNPDEITRRVTEANEYHARIYSFGIGGDVDARFLTALSEANSGEAIIFRNQNVDDVVDDFYIRHSRNALVDPEVEYEEGLETDSLYPPTLQNVAAGKQLMIAGRYGSFGEFDVELHGTMSGGDTTLAFEALPFPEENIENAFVPRLWAKEVIDYWLRWMTIHGERQEIIEKIIELSLEFGILTPYTGFVDPEEPPQDTAGPPPPDDSGANVIWEPDLREFRVIPVIGGVELSWGVSGVTGLVSFNLYKAPSPSGPWRKLNDTPIFGWRFVDASGSAGEVAFYRLEIVGDDQIFRFDPIQTGLLPGEIALGDPYPNPFNSKGQFRIDLPERMEIRLGLYSLDGREAIRLKEGWAEAGSHLMTLDSERLAAGSYILKLSAGDVSRISQVMIVK